MKKNIIILFLFVVAFSSCNKFLNTVPPASIVPENAYKTTDQIKAAVVGMYVGLRSSSMYGLNYLEFLTIPSDELYFYNATTPTTIFQNIASDALLQSFWQQAYVGINNANLLIDNIDASSNGVVDKSIVQKAKGEAYFLRGFYHFLLVQHFGDIPLRIHAIYSPDGVNTITRTPIKEVYNQIIADMVTADSLLVNQLPSNLGSERVTQTCVDGMLARVCLFAAGYYSSTQGSVDKSRFKDALYWSRKVINSGYHTLVSSYPQVFIDEAQNRYNKENIWEIGFNQFGNGVPSAAGCVGIYIGVGQTQIITSNGVSYYDSGYCYGYGKLFPRLYFSYQEGDTRRDWNCANYFFTNAQKKYLTAKSLWSRAPAKWRREYEPQVSRSTQRGSCTNFPVLRYSDVLLMFAEAENEVNGATDSAYWAINQVRRRAFSPTPVVASNVTITNSGNNYTTAPSVTFAGGGGSGADGFVTISNGKVTIVTITNPGSGYSTPPAISFSGGGGNGATATTTLSSTIDILLVPGLSQSDFRNAVRDERCRELAFEALRGEDLKRWGILIPTIQGLQADVNGTNPNFPLIPPVLSELGNGSDIVAQTPARSIGVKDWFWPIPLNDLLINKNLTQNPGY